MSQQQTMFQFLAEKNNGLNSVHLLMLLGFHPPHHHEVMIPLKYFFSMTLSHITHISQLLILFPNHSPLPLWISWTSSGQPVGS
jgi:hypothetical protein